MPIDDNQSQNLVNRLSQTIFKSPEDFVNYYNSGLINKRHEDVTSIVNELVTTYRNVKEQGGKILFISKNEIYLNELLTTLSDWEPVIKIKRDVRTLINEGVITEDSVIVFPTEHVGHFVEENSDERLNNERLFTKYETIQSIYGKVSSYRNDGGVEDVKFIVKDFTRIDDSFIERIHQMLP